MKFYSLIFFVIFFACAGPDQRARNDVRSVVVGILDADNDADLERVLSYYHNDAVLMPPGRAEIIGIENIRKNYEGIFASSMLELSPEEVEILVMQEHAIYKGRTKGKVILKSDSLERTIDDKFIMILKKEDGKWKIKTLIWN